TVAPLPTVSVPFERNSMVFRPAPHKPPPPLELLEPALVTVAPSLTVTLAPSRRLIAPEFPALTNALGAIVTVALSTLLGAVPIGVVPRLVVPVQVVTLAVVVQLAHAGAGTTAMHKGTRTSGFAHENNIEDNVRLTGCRQRGKYTTTFVCSRFRNG